MASLSSEAVYELSGCTSVTEFISSPAFCHSVQRADLHDYESSYAEDYSPLQPGNLPVLEYLRFCLKTLRAREEAGSLPCFLHALPTTMPSCSRLHLAGVELSLEELIGLCRGLASPLCTLHTLVLDIRLRLADKNDQTKRLIADALSRNGSLQCLNIISELCSQHRWIPSSVNDLWVQLQGDDTLDALLSLFSGLADNSISLSTITLTGPYIDFSREIDTLDFSRPEMLDSEEQLVTLLLTNTSLTAIHFTNLVMPKEAFRLLFSALNQNPRMTSFSLTGYVPGLPGDVVCMLFAALEKNQYLTSLDLSYNCGDDWPSTTQVLNSLCINGILSDLELNESPLDEFFCDEEEFCVSWEVLSAQLERNRRNVEQVKAFK